MIGLCNLATTTLIGTPQPAVNVSCRALEETKGSAESSTESVTSQWARVLLRCLLSICFCDN